MIETEAHSVVRNREIPSYRHGIIRSPNDAVSHALGYANWKTFLHNATPGITVSNTLEEDLAELTSTLCFKDTCEAENVHVTTSRLPDGRIKIDITVLEQQLDLPMFAA